MIEPAFFFEQVKKNGTDFFAGVPDSLLKNLCAYITDNESNERHIIPANEGSAVALATGHHLATGSIPLVYMQNSGIGNAVNPLLSLVDSDVYRIPMVLVIGWRGEPGKKDEPQHVTQGRLTCPLLETMGIPYVVMAEDHDSLNKQIDDCYRSIRETGRPFAFVVKKDSFAPYSLQKNIPVTAVMTRETAIETVLLASRSDDIFVSTTGMASRELYELREKHGMGHGKDFLTVGSMGHASQIALGIALEKKTRRVVCIDGDGAALMHMGALAINGVRAGRRFFHIVLNNEAHESVGGQPTVAGRIDLSRVAAACSYRVLPPVREQARLDDSLQALAASHGPAFLDVFVSLASRSDLGRPRETPAENKALFISYIQNDAHDGA